MNADDLEGVACINILMTNSTLVARSLSPKLKQLTISSRDESFQMLSFMV